MRNRAPLNMHLRNCTGMRSAAAAGVFSQQFIYVHLNTPYFAKWEFQSSMNFAIPASVKGWTNILLKTPNGTVAM